MQERGASMTSKSKFLAGLIGLAILVSGSVMDSRTASAAETTVKMPVLTSKTILPTLPARTVLKDALSRDWNFSYSYYVKTPKSAEVIGTRPLREGYAVVVKMVFPNGETGTATYRVVKNAAGQYQITGMTFKSSSPYNDYTLEIEAPNGWNERVEKKTQTISYAQYGIPGIFKREVTQRFNNGVLTNEIGKSVYKDEAAKTESLSSWNSYFNNGKLTSYYYSSEYLKDGQKLQVSNGSLYFDELGKMISSNTWSESYDAKGRLVSQVSYSTQTWAGEGRSQSQYYKTYQYGDDGELSRTDETVITTSYEGNKLIQSSKQTTIATNLNTPFATVKFDSTEMYLYDGQKTEREIHSVTHPNARYAENFSKIFYEESYKESLRVTDKNGRVVREETSSRQQDNAIADSIKTTFFYDENGALNNISKREEWHKLENQGQTGVHLTRNENTYFSVNEKGKKISTMYYDEKRTQLKGDNGTTIDTLRGTIVRSAEASEAGMIISHSLEAVTGILDKDGKILRVITRTSKNVGVDENVLDHQYFYGTNAALDYEIIVETKRVKDVLLEKNAGILIGDHVVSIRYIVKNGSILKTLATDETGEFVLESEGEIKPEIVLEKYRGFLAGDDKIKELVMKDALTRDWDFKIPAHPLIGTLKPDVRMAAGMSIDKIEKMDGAYHIHGKLVFNSLNWAPVTVNITYIVKLNEQTKQLEIVGFTYAPDSKTDRREMKLDSSGYGRREIVENSTLRIETDFFNNVRVSEAGAAKASNYGEDTLYTWRMSYHPDGKSVSFYTHTMEESKDGQLLRRNTVSSSFNEKNERLDYSGNSESYEALRDTFESVYLLHETPTSLLLHRYNSIINDYVINEDYDYRELSRTEENERSMEKLYDGGRFEYESRRITEYLKDEYGYADSVFTSETKERRFNKEGLLQFETIINRESKGGYLTHEVTNIIHGKDGKFDHAITTKETFRFFNLYEKSAVIKLANRPTLNVKYKFEDGNISYTLVTDEQGNFFPDLSGPGEIDPKTILELYRDPEINTLRVAEKADFADPVLEQIAQKNSIPQMQKEQLGGVQQDKQMAEKEPKPVLQAA